MDQIKNDAVDDKIIQLKKLVLEQLKRSKDLNMEYKLCLDYLNNCKDPKYKEFITGRTKMSAVDLHKYASSLVASVTHFVYEELVNMTEHQRADLLLDESKISSFMSKVNDFIRGCNNGIPVFSGKRD